MATKIFDVAQMACEDVQAWVGSCKFGTGSDVAFVEANVDDGAFVTLGGLCADTTYAGAKDWNVYHAFAPSAATLTAEDVVVIDISGVKEIAGYKIGVGQVDLVGAAGYPVRFRRIKKGDKIWLGQGNFVSAPTVGQYANLTANSVLLTPAASTTASQLNIKILAAKPLTIGALVNKVNSAYENIYLCEIM